MYTTLDQGQEMTDLRYSHIFITSISLKSQAAIVSEKSTFFTFSHSKAKFTKFDIAVKQVKVTQGSSFIQTMMGRSPRCYIPSFMEIGLPVLEKKIFNVSTIYGHGGHFGHVTSITLTNFHFLVPESFRTKLSSEWHSSF